MRTLQVQDVPIRAWLRREPGPNKVRQNCCCAVAWHGIGMAFRGIISWHHFVASFRGIISWHGMGMAFRCPDSLNSGVRFAGVQIQSPV
jgi:hypothetical protein